MKFRRKKVVEVEAYYLKNIRDLDIPDWLDRHLFEQVHTSDISCETASGAVLVPLPSWFIRKPKGGGAYPVSVEYFEENFEAVE